MLLNNDYTLLITQIIKEQSLDTTVTELPLIINCTDTSYIGAYITNENENYLSIITLNKEGREYAKILNKEYICSVEIFYDDMLPKENGELKGYD